MKTEFTIEQIREFVNKGYTSVSARYVKAMLQYYDEVVKNNAVLPHVSGSLLLDRAEVIAIGEYYNMIIAEKGQMNYPEISAAAQVWIETTKRFKQ